MSLPLHYLQLTEALSLLTLKEPIQINVVSLKQINTIGQTCAAKSTRILENDVK